MRDWLRAKDLEALVVTSPCNVRYLLGFAGEGMVVLGMRTVVLCTDRRYELDAGRVRGRIRVSLHEGGHLAGAAEAIKSARWRRVAFEADHLSVCAHDRLARELEGIELNPSHGIVEDLRLMKSAEEIDAIRRAAAIMDRALADTLDKLTPGCTEREVAAELAYAATLAGADAMAFEPIVAFGPASALPHARPGDCKLEHGQMVLIDCGAKVDGYCSDITRTVFLGEPDEQYREVYTAVLEAQASALDTAEAGFEGRDVDRAARWRLEDYNLADHFSHGVGHGLGLEVHEAPALNVRSRAELDAGMVITVEPGVYIEGWGGVRIEDTVLVKRRSCELLTQAPKQQW